MSTGERLAGLGFDFGIGQTVVLTGGPGPVRILAGLGPGKPTAADVRDAAAALSRTAQRHRRLDIDLTGVAGLPVAELAEAVVEGAILARYRFNMKSSDDGSPLFIDELNLVVDEANVSAAGDAAQRALIIVAATELGRDLATCPGGQLTATRFAEIAQQIGTGRGLDVEVFGREELVELGCGGLLGINLGSTEPPRMIKLRYTPSRAPTGHLTLVGKGIMYDSAGISLKPPDGIHAAMKNDMTGAGVVFAAMTTLADLDCPVAVTGYLMCTDNMPSGSALKMGDVLTIRGGTTVEVINTDAEGRIVMADALVLATEEPTDAIVDIATLTGACLRALGPEMAGVMGTSDPLVDQIRAAAERTDEPVWPFPLIKRYRSWMNSDIADIANLGGVHAGQITAALFLAEFVGDLPWAHIDIAGTAQADTANGWRCNGATGFGTRLLIDTVLNFERPDSHAVSTGVA